MKTLTSGVSRVGLIKLPRWGPRDPPQSDSWRQYMMWLNAAVSGILSLKIVPPLCYYLVYYIASRFSSVGRRC